MTERIFSVISREGGGRGGERRKYSGKRLKDGKFEFEGVQEVLEAPKRNNMVILSNM